MDSSRRWQRSTPWLRVWPAAALVLALHLAALHGGLVSPPGLQRFDPVVTSITVRILAPPAPSPAPPPREFVPAPVAGATPESAATGSTVARSPTREAPQVSAATPVSSAPTSPSPAPAAPPASDYVVASRLDPGPQLLEDVDPVYPPEAGLTEGSVVLRLLIGRTGTVEDVSVVRSLPKGVFDRSAVTAFAAARFSPGRMLGVAVKSQLTIEVHFTPIDRGGNVSPPTY